MNLTITPRLDPTTQTATLRVDGAVDYTTNRAFVTIVASVLADNPALRELRFDLVGLSFCDSSGLSGFIQVHRETSAAGVTLHIDNPPAHFDRLLDLTGVREHLIASSRGSEEPDDEARYEGGGSNS